MLEATAAELTALVSRNTDGAAANGSVLAVPGSVTDVAHHEELVAAARGLGGLDLLVNNASSLGPSPLPPLADYPLDALRDLYETNVVAPLALAQAALPLLRSSTRGSPAPGSSAPGSSAPGSSARCSSACGSSARGRLLDVTSDAAVEAYPGWGGYGSSKAALEQLSAVLAAEEPNIRVWWLDPGDLRTEMHQLAFPGEDISDRPLPEQVAPLVADLVESDLPSGRYRAGDLATLIGARR